MIKVSVVIPVYNVELYLEECLDSIISQTLREIEIICINDGSTDGSLAILERYCAKDNRLKIINTPNGGAGAARNKGLEIATGEYILFYDSDDYMSPKALQLLYDDAQRNGSDISMGRARAYYQDSGEYAAMGWMIDNKILKNNHVIHPQDYASHIFQAFKPAPWNKLYRRDFIMSIGLEFPILKNTEDLAFGLISFAEAQVISYIDNVIFSYRRHSKSLSTKSPKVSNCLHSALFIVYNALIKIDKYELYEQSFVNACIDHFRYHLNLIEDEDLKNESISLFYDLDKRFELRGRSADYYYDDSYTPWMYEIVSRYILSLREAPKEVDPTLDGVSIIIPVYNDEAYLELCVRSVMNQTYRGDIQIICVNDGSSDGSLAILKSLALEDSRITIIDQENAGLGISRNNALKIAKNKWVMFLDSDDFYELDSVESLSSSFAYDPDLIVAGFRVFGDVSKEFLTNQYTYYNQHSDSNVGRQEFSDYYRNCLRISVCGKMFKREIISRYNIFFPPIRHEDEPFSYMYMTVSKSIYLTKHRVYNRLNRSDSIMGMVRSGKASSKHYVYAAENLYEQFKRNNLLISNKDQFLYKFKNLLSAELLLYGNNIEIRGYICSMIDRLIKNSSLSIINSGLIDIKDQIKYYPYISVKTLCIFHIIPFITFKRREDKLKCFLFGILPIYKIKFRKSVAKHYLFGFLPIFKI